MPARHHRTLDRAAAALENVARHPGGLSLAELARTLEVPKSSLQSLVNGLVASGYLVEQGHRYFLGPAPFVLSLMCSPLAARIRHDELVRIHQEVQRNLLVGIQVGDALVYIDQVGDGPMVEYLAYTHHRRPLLTTATGKIILANLPSRDLQTLLTEFSRYNAAIVEEFLVELPSIRTSGLAYNHGTTMPDLYAVATSLRDADGQFIAGICVNGGREIADQLDVIGKELLQAIRPLPSEASLS